jgi:hypothetical protein
MGMIPDPPGRQIGDGDGGGPPIPGKSGMGMGMGIGGTTVTFRALSLGRSWIRGREVLSRACSSLGPYWPEWTRTGQEEPGAPSPSGGADDEGR